MPKDTSIKKILLIGSGPIVIGQGCEFDYSGVQACKALAEEGYDVVLVNSNPATIMTDPEFAQRTYIEPITPEAIEKILEREKPDAVLPTLGGQTALNAAMSLVDNGGPCSKRSRHIDIRYFWVKEKVQDGSVNVVRCPTETMWANILTKPVRMRIAGTAEDEAKALLADVNSPLIQMYPTMFEAADEAAKEANK